MTRDYALREHTADIAVEAHGTTLGACFAAVADGMAAAMCESIPESGGERFAIEANATTKKRLLYDYLDNLIYERDVRGVLPVDNEATVARDGEDWVLDASSRGVPLADVAARDLKAVTFSQMRIEETAAGWEAYVVFDV
ncbi:archease [Halarchaeum salinum]|uniref:Archease n=1 Tax=Halarchaeum salinum TaxID=489912 RepID=A0AAV3S656_9EURY